MSSVKLSLHYRKRLSIKKPLFYFKWCLGTDKKPTSNFIKSKVMEDNAQLFELLLKRVVDYGKTNIELIKLKLFDRAVDMISSLIPPAIVFVLISSFFLFLSLGLALWLGDILGNIYSGFILIAAFYGIMAIIVHFFMHARIKKTVSDYIIKQVLK